MDEFYSTKQIAKMLNLKTITIRRWIDRKLLPAYKLGKELRVRKQDFDRFLSKRRVKT
jgi:excisionase family DNA binding protein